MSIIKKILCPTDFSEASYEGLRYAVDLAKPGETELCVIHVEAELPDGIVSAADAAARRAEAVTNLSEVLEESVPAAINSRPLLRSGHVATEIVRAAREEGADLVILTTHGAAGWRQGVLGAVAEEVVRTAPCAVLTISAPASGIEHEIEHETDASEELVQAASPYHSAREKPDTATKHRLYLDGD